MSERPKMDVNKTSVSKLVKKAIAADPEKGQSLLISESKIKHSGGELPTSSPRGSIAGSQIGSVYDNEQNSVYSMDYYGGGSHTSSTAGGRPIIVNLRNPSKRRLLAPSVAGSAADDKDAHMSAAVSVSSLGNRRSFLASDGGVTERTMRELVDEIEKRAKLKQKAPYFVPTLEQLPPELLYWNKTGEKMKLPQRKRFQRNSTEKEDAKKPVTKVKSKNNISSTGSQSEASLVPFAAVGSISVSSLSPPRSPLVSSPSGTSKSNGFFSSSSKSGRSVGGGGGSNSADVIDNMSIALSLSKQQQDRLKQLKPHRPRPKPDIIGCMNPVELVLARADERSRKQTHALELRERACQEQIAAIDKVIRSKQSRSEKYAAQVAIQQRQLMWMKIIYVAIYPQNIAPRYEAKLKKYGKSVQYFESAYKIIKFLSVCYHSRINKKIMLFLMAIEPCKHYFVMQLRIWRKRRATTRLKDYLLACKRQGPQKMPVVIHRFVKSVKLIQNVARNFIACKQARITTLIKLWDKLEYRHIKIVLEKRKSNQAHIIKDAAIEMIDASTKLEMLKQNTKWATINGKMEEKIFELQLMGELRKTTEEETIQKLALSRDVKMVYVAKIVEQLRKELLLKQQEIESKFINKKKEFTSDDAIALLKGQSDHIDKIVNAKLAKIDVKGKHAGFMLFQVLDYRNMFNMVKQSHEIAKTFHIEINTSRRGRRGGGGGGGGGDKHNGSVTGGLDTPAAAAANATATTAATAAITNNRA